MSINETSESSRALRTGVRLALLAGVLTTATSCAADQPAAQLPTDSSMTTQSPPAPLPTAEQANPSTPADSVDEGGQRAAVAAAEDVVSALVSHTSYDAWWAALSEQLTPAGEMAFEYTDPAVIPARRVVDGATLISAPDGTSARVQVPTDAAPYVVTLIRQDVHSPWLADRIEPVERAVR